MKKLAPVVCLVLTGVLVSGCDNKNKEDEKLKLAQQINASMITVDGGRFQMGDFGPLISDNLSLTPDPDNKYLHWVELSDFKMTKNRITWGQFNQWLSNEKREKSKYYEWATEEKRSVRFKKTTGDSYPAVANWGDASLPTEAQWEYAARSRGQFRYFANSDNIYTGSVPSSELNFTFGKAPVGSFAPNPLGLYDMMGNGHDWVVDWYDENYYKNSPEKDPQGPSDGTKKVVRGYLGSMFGLYSVTRGQNIPETEAPGYGFRCVEN